MNFQVILVCLVAETIFLISVADGSGTTAKFRNLVCSTIDPNFIHFTYCRLKAINRTLTTLNMRATYLQTIRGLNYHFKIWKNSNGYKPFLFDITVDGCAFLSGNTLPVMEPFHKAFEKYTNMNGSCPLPKTVIVQDLPIMDSMLPTFWPAGEFRIDVKTIASKKPRAVVSVYLYVFDK